MPFKIVRNDIVKMKVDVIVNTASKEPIYSCGVDTAVYQAAGEEKLLAARKEIGYLNEGEVAITPGFDLPAKYIIHTVGPMYDKDNPKAEELLRSCYKKSLILTKERGFESIAFPIIATGYNGFPIDEGMRIALDEINVFLMKNEMMVYLVVFGTNSTQLGFNLYLELEAYIDHNYVCDKRALEYGNRHAYSNDPHMIGFDEYKKSQDKLEELLKIRIAGGVFLPDTFFPGVGACIGSFLPENKNNSKEIKDKNLLEYFTEDEYEEYEKSLEERINHISDTFQEYLFYMIKQKKLSNPGVYNNALITKQTFSKIKQNKNYHPDKFTAMRLCVGARLNLDETKDLLAKAGYALSSSDKRDIIFSFFIEKKIYDIYEIDIALEKYGLPCFIN